MQPLKKFITQFLADNENIKKKSKDNYKVIRTFNENEPSFQEVMEKIFLMKLNDLDKNK